MLTTKTKAEGASMRDADIQHSQNRPQSRASFSELYDKKVDGKKISERVLKAPTGEFCPPIHENNR
jgi:hypothetical protein